MPKMPQLSQLPLASLKLVQRLCDGLWGGSSWYESMIIEAKVKERIVLLLKTHFLVILPARRINICN